MADYPTSVYSPRPKQNKVGVIYTPLVPTTLFAEDISLLDAEVVAIETDLESKLDQAVKTTSSPQFADLDLTGSLDVTGALTIGGQFTQNYYHSVAGESVKAFDINLSFSETAGAISNITHAVFDIYESRVGTISEYVSGYNEQNSVNFYWLVNLASYTGSGNVNVVNYGTTGVIADMFSFNSEGDTMHVVNYAFFANVVSNESKIAGTLNVENYAFYANILANAGADSKKNYGLFIESLGTGEKHGIWDQSGADWVIDSDTGVITFGADQDATIGYDGTDLVVNPQLVGTGQLKIITGTDTYFRTDEKYFDLSGLLPGLELRIPMVLGLGNSSLPDVFPVGNILGFYDKIAIVNKDASNFLSLNFASEDFQYNAQFGCDLLLSEFVFDFKLRPTNDNTVDLGMSTYQWKDLLIAGKIIVGGTSAVTDGTYTVGIGGTTNGTITVKGGIITAVQEAV